MQPIRHQRGKALLLAFVAISWILLATKVLMAQNPPVFSSFQLSPGVVVNLGRGEAYVMKPDGGISAVDLAGGKEVWHSNDAARPLTLAGDLLISQAEPRGSERELKIVTLDTRTQGQTVTVSAVELPPGVKALIGKSPNKLFDANVRLIDGDAAVSWQYIERPIRGTPPRAPEVHSGDFSSVLPAKSLEIRHTGEFRLDILSGAVKSHELDVAPTPILAPILERAVEVPLNERLLDVPGPQFLSADGRSILTSERTTDDSIWEKYLWTIYQRNTRVRVGQVKSHVSFAPFFVVDTKIIYEIGPYAKRMATGVLEEPLQIQAADLRTGERVWSQTVRDLAVRTAPPP